MVVCGRVLAGERRRNSIPFIGIRRRCDCFISLSRLFLRTSTINVDNDPIQIIRSTSLFSGTLDKTQDWKIISKQFNNILNFTRCVGSINGKHIIIQSPISSKYFFGIGLLTQIITFNLLTGCQRIKPIPNVILAREAFILSEKLMNDNGTGERIFYYRLSSARRIVEMFLELSLPFSEF